MWPVSRREIGGKEAPIRLFFYQEGEAMRQRVVTVRMSPELHHRLLRESWGKRRSMNRVCLDAIEKHLGPTSPEGEGLKVFEGVPHQPFELAVA